MTRWRDDLRLFLDVARLGGLTAATATTATKNLAKNITKRIAKTSATRATHSSSIGIDTRMSVAVIRSTLIFVRQNFISLFGLFEFLFGFLAVGIAIGVILHRQLAVGLF